MTDGAEQNSSTEQPIVKKQARGGWRILVLFIILATIAFGVWHYKLWRKIHHPKPTPQQTLQQTVADLQAQVVILQENQQRLLTLFDQHGYSDEQLVLHGVQALLLDAETKLNVEHDQLTALALLNTAQQKASSINSITLNRVQKSIAADIKRVQANGGVDINQLNQQFAQLNEQIWQLPFHQAPQAPVKSAADHSWQAKLERTFKNIIVIEHTDARFVPIINQQQALLVKQYLSTLYAQAFWAALHHNPAIYRSALHQVELTMQHYFLPTNQAAQAILKQTIALIKQDVAPSQESLQSLKLVKKLVHTAQPKVSKTA